MFDTTLYRFAELKAKLFAWGHAAIEDFLNFEYDMSLSKDAIENLMNQVFDQMPDDVFEQFYAKYCGECIDAFNGDYDFLSNFYPVDIVYDGCHYRSTEAAFQAAKCANPADRVPFESMTPGAAKRAGRKVALRPNWDSIKDNVMYELLITKFFNNPALGAMLVATKNATLIEGNNWHDHYWGVCDGEGQNHLGKLLMRVRENLRPIYNTQNPAK